MKFNIKLISLEKLATEAVAVFVWEGPARQRFAAGDAGGEKEWPKEALRIDKALGGLLRRVAEEEEFKAKAGEILTLHTHGKMKPSRILLAGLGKRDEFDLAQLRRNFALLGRKAKSLKIKTLGLGFSFAKSMEFDLEQIAQGAAEGLLLGTYKFLRYKGEQDKEGEREIEEVLVSAEQASDLMHVKEGIRRGEFYSQATIFARDLINEPSSVTTPTHLAQVAKRLIGGQIKGRIFDKSQMEKMGLGGILGVARGSDEPPKLIRLEYKHPQAKKKIILVGKTVTFDAGGLSLKPSEAMETMKMDMAGGAAVLAIFSVLPKICPKLWVVGLVPATENMPSGKAIKPGDILRARNGKTIEILNTDAEGRVILADALSLGAEEKPQLLLDLATLTGACEVALGQDVAGIFSDDKDWLGKVENASRQVGEAVWSLPLVKDYKEMLKSEVADIKNITKSRYGGAITAALFLQEFTDGAPWVHLDIAGPAFVEKETPLVAYGGSGFGVRTVLNLLENL